MLVPTSEKTPQPWSYTFEKPADNWFKPGADLSGWKEGPSIFGHKVHRNFAIHVNTEWTRANLWLVRKFELTADKLKRPVLRIAYDDNATVYINGVRPTRFEEGQ